MIFPKYYTDQLTEIFLKKDNGTHSVTSSSSPVSEPATMEDEAYEDADGEPYEDDVDGEAMEDDIDGEPMEDDIDGEPIEDDIDGEPMEDDIDGQHFEQDVHAKQETEALYTEVEDMFS